MKKMKRQVKNTIKREKQERLSLRKIFLAIGLMISLVVIILLAGCQQNIPAEKTTTDAELQDLVTRFAVPKEMTAAEMKAYLQSNLNYTEDPYRSYLKSIIDYFSRVDRAFNVFQERYSEECGEDLSKQGCYNSLEESTKMRFKQPKDIIKDVKVADKTSEKAAVQMVTDRGRGPEVRTYYLKRTKDGWKVYDMFDYHTKKAVSDITEAELESSQNVNVFRLRAELRKISFPKEQFEKDPCVKVFTKDYVINTTTNEAAIECYKDTFAKASKHGTEECKNVFPSRYNSICLGLAMAGTGGNCSMVTAEPAYDSPSYGILTKRDICNFYYSMGLKVNDAETIKEAIENCRNIKNPRYRGKCLEMFQKKNETDTSSSSS